MVFFNFSNFYLHKKNEFNKKENIDFVRSEFNEIAKIINKKKINKESDSLLTFDNRFMIWAVLSDKISTKFHMLVQYQNF